MNFLENRTPAIIGFDGKNFESKFLSIFNCSSNQIGVIVSNSNYSHKYNHISMHKCSSNTGGELNPNQGDCQLSDINITSTSASDYRGSGIIFLANSPNKYFVSYVNFIDNNHVAGYSIASSDTSVYQITKNVNFINSVFTLIFYIFPQLHLLESVCIFQCKCVKLYLINMDPTYSFENCKTDNSTFSDSFTVTAKTTNSISSFTVNLDSMLPFCSIRLSRAFFDISTFIFILNFLIL